MINIHVLNIEGQTILPIHGDGKTESFAAGYDVVAVSDPVIVGQIGEEIKLEDGTPVTLYKSIDYIQYNTALKIAPQSTREGNKHHTYAFPRSSVRKYNLLLANSVGVIDTDYRGEILVSFKYVFQPEDFVIQFTAGEGNVFQPKGLMAGVNREKIYKKGDKIAQLIADQTNFCNYSFVSELTQTARGEGGHGSTDRGDKTVTFDHLGEVKTLTDRYVEAGGVPTRKRYSDEMKERERNEGAPKVGNTVIPKPGIHERTSK